MKHVRVAVTILFVAATFVFVPAAPVSAYSTLGCKWTSATLTWRNAGSSTAYRDAGTAAISAWDATATPLSLTSVSSGESIRVWDVNFGNTGFDGITLDQNYADPVANSCGGAERGTERSTPCGTATTPARTRQRGRRA